MRQEQLIEDRPVVHGETGEGVHEEQRGSNTHLKSRVEQHVTRVEEDDEHREGRDHDGPVGVERDDRGEDEVDGHADVDRVGRQGLRPLRAAQVGEDDDPDHEHHEDRNHAALPRHPHGREPLKHAAHESAGGRLVGHVAVVDGAAPDQTDEPDNDLEGHHAQPLLPQQQERHEDEEGEELERVGDREPQQEPAQPATQVGAQPQQDEDDHDDVVLDDDEDRDEQRHRRQEEEGDPLAALPADAEVTRDIHQHLGGEKRGQHHHGLEPQLRRRRQQVLEAGDPVDDVGRQVPQPEEQVERDVVDRRVTGRGVLDRDPVEVADPPLKNRVQEVEGVLEGGSHVPVEEEGVGAEQDDAQQRPVHEAGTLGTAPPGAQAAVHHALDQPASLIARRLSERAHPCDEAGGGAGLRRGVVIGFLGVVVLDLTRFVLRGLTGHESLPVHRGGGQWSPRRRRRDAPGGLCGR